MAGGGAGVPPPILNRVKCHMGKEFICTGSRCNMFEDQCVKVAINLGGGRKTSVVKIPLSVTEAICRRPIIAVNKTNQKVN